MIDKIYYSDKESTKKPDFMLMNYHQLASKINDEHLVLNEVRNYLSDNNVSIFIDESHRMKGGEAGEHGRSVLSLSTFSNKKLILSGTPMPQGSMDLVGQFKFLYPSVSGVNEDTVVDYFQDRFVRTTKAQMGLPDMKLPIQYALTYPNRFKTDFQNEKILLFRYSNFTKYYRKIDLFIRV